MKQKTKKKPFHRWIILFNLAVIHTQFADMLYKCFREKKTVFVLMIMQSPERSKIRTLNIDTCTATAEREKTTKETKINFFNRD